MESLRSEIFLEESLAFLNNALRELLRKLLHNINYQTFQVNLSALNHLDRIGLLRHIFDSPLKGLSFFTTFLSSYCIS